MTASFSWQSLCERAQARARDLGERVVACAVFGAPNGQGGADAAETEPIALLERLNGSADGEFRFAWERPKDGFALAGGGAAMAFMAEGERRFQELSERVDSALRHAVTEYVESENGASPGDTPVAPVAVGGFSFFDRLDAVQWPGFGAAQMVIPRWLALHAGGRRHTVISTAVEPDADVARVAMEMQALGERLHNGNGNGHGGAATPQAGAGAGAGAHPADDVEGHRRWLEMVRQAVTRIRGGGLSKVVLARAVELLGRLPLPLRAFRSLRAAYPDCFTFWIDPGQGQGFLGASPERLARLERGTLHLGALAGTAPRGDRPDSDEAHAARLLGSPKQREEHAIVLNAVLEAARPLGGTLDYPETPRLVKLTNVQHLYTPVTVTPPAPASLIALLGRLHPTPAVGGHPREDALGLIRDEEGFDRGWYAGPVGWIDARGDGEFAVALRSGTLRTGRARLFSGAGIVADSDPEMEYFETQMKLQPMLNALLRD
jgi:isochorismate synthase